MHLLPLYVFIKKKSNQPGEPLPSGLDSIISHQTYLTYGTHIAFKKISEKKWRISSELVAFFKWLTRWHFVGRNLSSAYNSSFFNYKGIFFSSTFLSSAEASRLERIWKSVSVETPQTVLSCCLRPETSHEKWNMSFERILIPDNNLICYTFIFFRYVFCAEFTKVKCRIENYLYRNSGSVCEEMISWGHWAYAHVSIYIQ